MSPSDILKKRVLTPLVFGCLLIGSTTYGNMDDPKLERLKAATVFITVNAGIRSGSGSGFLVHRDDSQGIIMTNNHVIETGGRRAKISVVFHSGDPNEIILSAEVLDRNEADDLALLRVNHQFLPEPIQIPSLDNFKETQEVYILGFPFGKALTTNQANPSITISKGIISSKRRDETDQLVLYQIDGDINPGNSGGPIVSPGGILIGVSFATVSETNIGFAIPSGRASPMIEGTIKDFEVIFLAPTKISFQAKRIDPFNRIKYASIVIVPESKVSMGKDVVSDGSWSSIANVGEMGDITDDTLGDAYADVPWSYIEGENVYYIQTLLFMRDKGFVYQEPLKMVIDKDPDKAFDYDKSRVSLVGITARGSEPPNEEAPSQRSDGPALASKNYPEQPKEVPVYHIDSFRTPLFEDVILGGGGKYLIFRFYEEPQIRVFDISSGQWVSELQLNAYDILMAANRGFLFLGLPEEERIICLEIDTLQVREVAFQLPPGEKIKAISVGYDSLSAPLLVATDKTVHFIDPATMLSKQFKWSDKKNAGRESNLTQVKKIQLRASADGQTFTSWSVDLSPCGISVLRLREGTVYAQYRHECAGYLVPGPDGRYVYTFKKGLFRVADEALSIIGAQDFHREHLIPGIQGPDYLRVIYNRKAPPILAVYGVDSHLPLFFIRDLVEMKPKRITDRFYREILSEDKRVLLFTRYQKLITIPYSNMGFVIREVEIPSD